MRMFTRCPTRRSAAAAVPVPKPACVDSAASRERVRHVEARRRHPRDKWFGRRTPGSPPRVVCAVGWPRVGLPCGRTRCAVSTQASFGLAFTVLVVLATQAFPAADGRDRKALDAIEPLVQEAIAERQLPGAVVLVGRGNDVVYREAIGNRAVVPAVEPMTFDTIFDLASLTKVVATTPAIMLLLEQGRIGLDDAVAQYIPEFGKYGKQRISIRHMLTHVSGLRGDLDMALEFQGTPEAVRLASEEVPLAPPGQRFIYSDINYFLLGEIVARVSGEPLDRFTKTRIFDPLDMKDTMFLPPADRHDRVAPTEACRPLGWPCGGPGATMLRGVVHDPTARRMGGVAGHAGLFSTAADLARFCRMLLGNGTLGRERILSPLSVALMTRGATPPELAQLRGLGWDIDSRFAANRGDLFPVGSFGHTGWTGTSLWMDPVTRAFVVFLSNRVHPDGTGDVAALRGRVATVAAAAVSDAAPPAYVSLAGRDFGARRAPVSSAPRPPEPVLTGIDVLRMQQFAPLRDRRVGLVTNHTGLTRDGASTIDVLREAPGVALVALFSPEHGIRGILDESVPSTRDEKTGLPIHSLYGETRRPTDEMLAGIDTMVIDLQDIGARFYTYMTTVAYVMEEAARRQIRVVVLDRPNPVNGFSIEGPVQDEAAHGFIAYFSMPTRHGMTLGELARLFNGENGIGADLVVVPMRNWSRDRWYDETGLTWVNPSPNMRNMNEATLYPGVGSIEYANISVGRGTDTPFEQIGAPWVDGPRLAAELNERRLPGVRFYPVSFTPTSSKYAGERCSGVFLLVTDREALRPARLGLEVAAAIARLHGATFETNETWRLYGSREQLERARAGESLDEITATWAIGEARWRERRAKYLLY
jgi:uncharacterized protein YbbC (DUF1343 family)/CubicO group peptidase (beta-lactamase class C family)